MEVKDWSYEEFPEFTEEIAGVQRISSTGDEIGTYCLPMKEYANIDGKALHIQIIKPMARNLKAPKKGYPCIVYIQGSAWMEQNHLAKIGMLARVSERGYIVTIIEYRHSGIAAFPAQAIDARNAIRYMKKNAEKYNVDVDNIFVVGDSSGGHTAFFSQIIKDDDENTNLYPGISADVNGIVSLYGSCSVMLDDGMPTTLNHHMPDSPEGMEMGGVDLRNNMKLRQKLSVECNINEDTELPPVLMFHGTKDRVINTRVSVLVYQRLKELGKEVCLYLIEGADHGGAEFWTKETIDIMEIFLKDHRYKKE